MDLFLREKEGDFLKDFFSEGKRGSWADGDHGFTNPSWIHESMMDWKIHEDGMDAVTKKSMHPEGETGLF